MLFDVYYPFKSKEGRLIPGVTPHPSSFSSIIEMTKEYAIRKKIEEFRNGDKSAKLALPAVCWTGTCYGRRRQADMMEPTQFVMLDIDHCEDPTRAAADVTSQMLKNNEPLGLVHITPSGKGLRYVLRCAVPEFHALGEYIAHYAERYNMSFYGDVDTAVKDLSRLSFMPQYSDILFTNFDLMEGKVEFGISPIISTREPQSEVNIETPQEADGSKKENAEPSLAITQKSTSFPQLTDDEKEKYDSFDYRGTSLKTIIEKYIEVFGTPGAGEIHNFYNEMVKNFRCICDNDKKLLFHVLPRFGHGADECWSQIVSICRVNTLSRLPRTFYFFLKDNGYYKEKTSTRLSEYMMSDNESCEIPLPPYLPPVFREFVGTAPRDFVFPCINALLPILGTLTSYLCSTYPYDGREHTTSFFSVIYAPAGTGKGFVERLIDILFRDLRLRDLVQSERENVYLRVMQKKGANDKAPDAPHVSTRIIPPKNSEAEFLQKQRDNHGYHMFTYAAEMDSWAKGVRAAGGNKDDMIRIAWDNGEYGQQFKSFNTFKGMVRLYWNVLITGTPNQLEAYFKNVENGLVTRCGFSSIENQEFKLAPSWGMITKRGLETVHRFMERCDRLTYKSPCDIDVTELMMTKDDEFDQKIDWRFEFQERQHVDMSWLMPTLDAFQSRQMTLAAKDVDRARDVFRRRVGVRGFRLGMLCTALWENPRASDLEKCIPFIEWYMEQDLESSLKLWGSRYNELSDVVQVVSQRKLFDLLPDEFSRTDVYELCMKQGVKTPVRRILFEWRHVNCVEELSKDKYKKTTVKTKRKK